MSKYTRSGLSADLQNAVKTVTFEKVDGSTREMTCTLDTTMIPADMLPSGSAAVINEEVLPVFDTVAGGWRSFRVESVSDVADA